MRESNFYKYIIVGAGLSGLTLAYTLKGKGHTNFKLLEARERVGGRILTENKIDLGAAWYQNHHHQITNLLKELEIDSFNQYSKGKSVLVYNTMAPEHYFENDQSAPAAFRIAGGSTAVIQGLSKHVQKQISIQTKVESITNSGKYLTVVTNKGVFECEKCIVTLPPKLATTITYHPSLPEKVITVMEHTHTWMSNAMKIGLTFKKPFWRDKNLSGMVIGQVGPVIELYDHSDYEHQNYALMGFINEGLRDVLAEERKSKILTYLSKYLGDEVLNYQTYLEKDWSKDEYTACKNSTSTYMSPTYGNAVFKKAYHQDKLLFSGTETSEFYGGYMEGAVYSGVKSAERLLKM